MVNQVNQYAVYDNSSQNFADKWLQGNSIPYFTITQFSLFFLDNFTYLIIFLPHITYCTSLNAIITMLNFNSSCFSWSKHCFPDFHSPWNICSGCGMPAGDAYSYTWVLPFFGTCLCCNCWDKFFRTCRVFSQLFTLNIPRYYLDYFIKVWEIVL